MYSPAPLSNGSALIIMYSIYQTSLNYPLAQLSRDGLLPNSIERFTKAVNKPVYTWVTLVARNYYTHTTSPLRLESCKMEHINTELLFQHDLSTSRHCIPKSHPAGSMCCRTTQPWCEFRSIKHHRSTQATKQMSFGPQLGIYIAVTTFDEPNCKGSSFVTTFERGSLGGQVTHGYPKTSFRLPRAMLPKEQIDISSAEGITELRAANSANACEKWLRSYFAKDSVLGCQNVDQPFTCLKVWYNSGLGYIG
jgi:hypothetical protein